MQASPAEQKAASRAWVQVQRKERLAREAAKQEVELSELPLVQAARARSVAAVARILAAGDSLDKSELAAIIRGPVPATFAPGWEREEWPDDDEGTIES